jgi:hypothetical protein
MQNNPTQGNEPNAPDPRSDFERFRDLTRRILTTPKTELMKNAPTKAGPKKRRRK